MSEDEQGRIARHVILRVKPGKMSEFRRAYKAIMKRQLKEPGIRRIYLLEAADEPGKVFSVILWDSEEDAKSYAEKGGFKRNLDYIIDMLKVGPEVTITRVLEHAVSSGVEK